MQRAIKCTCSYCQRERYFDASVGISLETIAGSTCGNCGQSGAVITLNIEPPAGAKILDRVPRAECHHTPGP